MKIKLYLLLSIIILSTSCKNDPSTKKNSIKDVSNNNFQNISQKELKYTLNYNTKIAIENWEAYDNLVEIVNSIKNNDLNILKSNSQNVAALFINLNSTIPEAVRTNATEARITAVKTKFFKLKSIVNLSNSSQKDKEKAKYEFLESFSNLNFQMNKKLEKDANFIPKPQ